MPFTHRASLNNAHTFSFRSVSSPARHRIVESNRRARECVQIEIEFYTILSIDSFYA